MLETLSHDKHVIMIANVENFSNFNYYCYRSVIREWLEDEHGQRMPEYVVKETPQLLNCTGPKLFWVSWQDGVIMVSIKVDFAQVYVLGIMIRFPIYNRSNQNDTVLA